MRKLSFLLFIPFLLCCNTKHDESCIQDIGQEHLVYATIWFQSSPEARAIYYQGFNLAMERVKEYAGTKGSKPQAVIVDIDETMVDNSLFQGKSIELGKPYSSEFWMEWSVLAKASALPGAVDFSLFCDSLGVEIFYISNRKTIELESTLKNLDSLGFAFAKPENFLLRTTTGGKQERRNIVSEKYDVILLLGDNLNDFSDVFENRGDDWGLQIVDNFRNEFGKRFIVFPNPMYGDWEKNVYGPQRDQNYKEMFIKRRAAVKNF